MKTYREPRYFASYEIRIMLMLAASSLILGAPLCGNADQPTAPNTSLGPVSIVPTPPPTQDQINELRKLSGEYWWANQIGTLSVSDEVAATLQLSFPPQFPWGFTGGTFSAHYDYGTGKITLHSPPPHQTDVTTGTLGWDVSGTIRLITFIGPPNNSNGPQIWTKK